MATEGAHDPGGHRVLEPEGIADGNHPLPHAELVRIAELDGNQVRGAVDLDERDIRLRIAADDLGLELLAGVELDDDLVGVLDDVVVGENVAGGVDDEPGAEALRLEGPAGIAEEALEGAEEVVEGVLLAFAHAAEGILHLLRGGDVHHRGRDVRREVREVRERHRRGGRAGAALALAAEDVEGAGAHDHAGDEAEQRGDDEPAAARPRDHVPSFAVPRTSAT